MEITYISIDPKPIEDRIRELQKEQTGCFMRFLYNNNKLAKQKYSSLESHINDLKKIIGK